MGNCAGVCIVKVLFICLDHYPYNGACTSLLEKMLHRGGLKKLLGEVHILTIKERYDEADVEYINGVTVHRSFFLSAFTKKDILKLFVRKPILALHATAAKLPELCKKHILRRDTVIKDDFKNTLVRQLKKLDIEAYDVIIPVCGAYETAAATMEYLEHSSAKMVVYQVDPCATRRTTPKLSRRGATEFEQKLYEKADAIITTPILYRYICENYSESILKKSCAMEFPNVDPGSADTCLKETGEYKCVYAGSIYALARNPKYTVDIFNLFENLDIKLHFVGTEEKQIYEYVKKGTVGERFVFHGRLPLEDARKKIEAAEILVNIGNIMTNQVPSKIFEYISACKPIVNICANSNCPSMEYLQKYPLAISVVEGVGTPVEHAKEIEKFILENAGKSVDKEVVRAQFKECTADYCAKQMCQRVKSVLGEGKVQDGQNSNNSQQ